MTRPLIFSEPLVKDLPRVRVSENVHRVVREIAEKFNISVSDIVRACLAEQLGFHYENSELLMRVLKDTAQEVSSSLENNNEGEE